MSAPALRIVLPDLAATRRLGRRLGELAQPGDVITLTGDLGAGKTTLTQAIGEGLAVPADDPITSPTFGLVHEHPGRLPLYHMDFYRLRGEDEVAEVGVEEYLEGRGVCVIEWPDRLGGLLPAERLEMELAHTGTTSRLARLSPVGARWEDRLTLLERELSR
ncbi:MAG: tRNA (adenosine(37)-N6)-threonylcarbamoyltransferase complex ATPase subunit type 1 TsaE [Thermodesulfobacteriota bacterium]